MSQGAEPMASSFYYTKEREDSICQLDEVRKAAMLHAQVIIGDSHNFVRADEAAVNIEPDV